MASACISKRRGLTWLLYHSIAGVGDFLPLGLVRILVVVKVTKAAYFTVSTVPEAQHLIQLVS